MPPHAITIRNETDRAKVAGWLVRAPYGYRVQVDEPKRSDPQNDRMWWLLSKIAKQLVWHGQPYSPEDWKDYFCHHMNGGKWMPSENGGFVPIGHRTSRMSVKTMIELQALIEQFCAKQEIKIDD